MKTGDRVKLKGFKSNEFIEFTTMMSRGVGLQVVVKSVNNSDGTFSIGTENGEDIWWLQSACEPVKTKRYFLVAYTSEEDEGSFTIISSSGKMPSYKEMQKQVCESLKKDIKIAITNIFEFESEQDFLDFDSNE